MENLGQLVMTGISGLEITSEEFNFLKEEEIGGVLLFSHNYENKKQLIELSKQIQSTSKEVPVFVGVDQEGGRVARFKNDFSKVPPMLNFVENKSKEELSLLFKNIASELISCGINLNLAPVCDIFNNNKNEVIGDRAFGKTASDVLKFTSIAIESFKSSGLLSCAKHFPGHGNTLEDSHKILPTVKKEMKELEKEELLPFVGAIKKDVNFIMMAHLIVESIDKTHPTSLSKNSYDLLREKLEFKGLIITDDMEMKAITDNYKLEEAAVLAIYSGANIVEYRSMKGAQRALEALKKESLSNSNYLKKQIDQVLQFKKKNFF